MATKLNPATPGQTATRRKELFLAFCTKVFAEMQRRPNTPVKLRSALGPRSEIMLGFKGNGTMEDAQDTVIQMFCDKYPLLAESGVVDAE